MRKGTRQLFSVLLSLLLTLSLFPAPALALEDGPKTPEAAQEETGARTDGTFRGTGKGRNGDIVLDVTVKDGKITEIQVVSQEETSQYWSEATAMFERIIQADSTEVDTVTHATLSSKGIVAAVKDALGETGSDEPQEIDEPDEPGLSFFASGDGSEEEPYVIESQDQLEKFGRSVASGETYAGKFVALGRSIDLTSEWTPIGGAEGVFNGTFDGCGYTVSGLTIGSENEPKAVEPGTFWAFFAQLADNARVKDLNLEDVSIYVTSREGISVGGISGVTYNYDGDGVWIDHCSVTGKLSVVQSECLEGQPNLGGISGYLYAGAVTNCFADVDISCVIESGGGMVEAGGLVGVDNAGLVANSYSVSTVTGKACQDDEEEGAWGRSWISPLVGFTGGFAKVAGCYSDGAAIARDQSDGAGLIAGYAMWTSLYNCYYSESATLKNGGETQEPAATGTQFPTPPWGSYSVAEDVEAVSDPDTAVQALNGLANDFPVDLAAFGLTEDDLYAWTVDEDAPGGVRLEKREIAYLLMNIPYAEFYGDSGFDAVTSATTKNKAAYFWDSSAKGNQEVAYGADTTIFGVRFPVRVTDSAALPQVTDASAAYYHSYAPLTDTPAVYRNVTVEDGQVTFGAIQGTETTLTDAQVEVNTDSKHGDYLLILSEDGGVLTAASKTDFAVYGAVLETAAGKTFGLRHLENLYYKDFHEIALCTRSEANQKGLATHPAFFADLEGETITKITYYTNSGILTVPAEVTLQAPAKPGYVLMNIPYADFYQAELGEGDKTVDAVTSATKNKPRTGTLAGGSYHVSEDGSDITGVTYPVYVPDLSVLEGLTEITDTDSVSITVTNRGQETTTVYEGADALFQAPSYAYYRLTEDPAVYKTLSGAQGSFSFSAVSAAAASIEGTTGAVTYNARHADTEIKLTIPEGVDQNSTKVSGVVLTLSDGTKYGLRHVANVWRVTELGWNQEEMDLSGKTITNIRYITADAVYDYPTDIAILPAMSPAPTASFKDSRTLILTGLPEDAAEVTVTLSYTEGEGREAVTTVVAENVAVTDGAAALSAAAEDGRAYTVTVSAANYAPAVLTDVAYTAPKDTGKSGGGRSSTAVREDATQSVAPAPQEARTFADVPSGAYYEKAVAWAVEQGITSGVTATAFAPDRACTRAQVVTFLYRAAGSPAVSGGSAFADVPAGAYYEKAVVWAVEQGITRGTTETTFSPDAIVTRAQAATFLYRYAKASAGGETAFTDVPADAYYAPAVQWAAADGITTGTTATTFSPDRGCTRGQIVTFLYRYLGA